MNLLPLLLLGCRLTILTILILSNRVSGDDGDPCRIEEEPCAVGYKSKQKGEKCIECAIYKRRKVTECASNWKECGDCLEDYEEVTPNHEYCVKSKPKPEPTQKPSSEEVTILFPTVLAISGIVFISGLVYYYKRRNHKHSNVTSNSSLDKSPSAPAWEIEMNEMEKYPSEEALPLVNTSQTSIRIPEENDENAVIVKENTIQGYTSGLEDQRLLQAVPINAAEPNEYATFDVAQLLPPTQPNQEELVNDDGDSANHEANDLINAHNNGVPDNATSVDTLENAQQDAVPNNSIADSGYVTQMTVDPSTDDSESSGMSLGSGYSEASTALVEDDITTCGENVCQGIPNLKHTNFENSEESSSSSHSSSYDNAKFSVNMEVNINFRLQS